MQKKIKEIGTIILLDSGFEAIYKRIKSHPNAQRKLKKRPLFTTPQKAREIYDQRVKEYKKVADFIVNVENKSAEKIALNIKELIEDSE